MKDGLLMPALAAGEENVIRGVATLIAELGQAVQNRTLPFLAVYQFIITFLSDDFFTSIVSWIRIQLSE